MADPTYPLFPILAFLGFFLSLVPLPWHLKAWNSGTCFYMMWASLASLNQFVNSVIWHNNAMNPEPFWCDISIRIMMASSVGLPAASLCINRRLYHIISACSASTSSTEKKHAILVDTLICVFLPLIYVALQIIVQGHRFNIFEDIGCFPAMQHTLLLYFVSSVWPFLIGFVSAIYCILTLRCFSRRRIEFSTILAAHPCITVWRYFRLMALAMTELLVTMPLSAFVIWLNLNANPLEPYISWEDTHFHFFRIEQYSAAIWHQNRAGAMAIEFTRWVVPACALIFFVFFGFAEEARKNYASLFSGFQRLLFKPGSPYKTRTLKIASPLPSYNSESRKSESCRTNESELSSSALSCNLGEKHFSNSDIYTSPPQSIYLIQ